MNGGGSTVELIDIVDTFARTLYMRAKQSSTSFADAAVAVKQLHIALRHLRVEAADQDSLLNSTESSVYARQLRPLVEDCEFALQQLETILDKFGDGNGPRNSDDDGTVADRIAAARNKLANEKVNVDMFLDTVQLHNPATKPAPVAETTAAASTTAPGLEAIKDKLDAVAKKVFSRRDSGFSDGGDVLWQEFKTELEKEGFSPDVLRKHKDVLRAYIREMEAMSSLNGGAPPTVRGLLEYEANGSPGKEMFNSVDNEKCLFTMKAERRMPDHAPAPAPMQPPYERQSNSSQDTGSETSDALALISTRDLMAMDSLNTGMAAMHLQPPNQNYNLSSSRGSPKYLASHMADTLPPPHVAELSSSPISSMPGTSPRTISHLPPYGSAGVPPPPYGTSPRSVPRLAPDRYGKDIAMEAQWTKIKRSLVSSEVLQRAGVRYEARPEYVAVLGRLTREQIADFARQSADCRAARSRRNAHLRPADKYAREREDSKSSRDDDDDDSVLWDESDSTDDDDDKTSEKGTKSYPYIVNPPEKKSSPSTTVPPKPILKNKNDNHVRFDPQPHDAESKSPGSVKDRDYRDRRREQHRRHRDHRDREAPGRHRDSDRKSAERDRRSSERHRTSGHDDDYYRRDHRDRRGDSRDDRNIRKKAWGETIVAGGIGGAAVSLLSVLAEAASSI